MPQTCSLRVHPDSIRDAARIQQLVAKQLGIAPNRIQHLQVLRRSIDARKRPVTYQLRVQAWVDEPFTPKQAFTPDLPHVQQAREVMVVGMGPAGLFAALQLIQLGLKPVIVERGKAVRDRRRDLVSITRHGTVHPDSNYCFGEGGAGTFSDGKLYTRSTKRGDTQRILQWLVHFGAQPDILVEAHPHIGTNKLPTIITQLREAILAQGGEILFDTRLTDLRLEGGQLSGVMLNGHLFRKVDHLILATGHSARDVFELLHRRGLALEAKPFALGVRVEHPQSLIDRIQYHCQGTRHENLPAAAYSLVRQVKGKGVYSFCMCPGGIICPAATANDEIVVNGWSPSKRNSPFANSGMVVEVPPQEFGGAGPLAGLAFQQAVEQRAYAAGGGAQVAPAQRLHDFVNGKGSTSLPACSYLPGISAQPLKTVLPKGIHERLREGFRYFGKRMKGYLTNEAVVVAVESRTSSPVRIPRDRDTLAHPQLAGLYPCGEGAGYAGGIMSAALDGQRCARAVARSLGVAHPA